MFSIRQELVPREDDSTFVKHSSFQIHHAIGVITNVNGFYTKKKFIFPSFRTENTLGTGARHSHQVGLLPSHRDWEMVVLPPLDANIPKSWFSSP